MKALVNARKVAANLLKLADAMSNLTVGDAPELSTLLKRKWNLPVPKKNPKEH